MFVLGYNEESNQFCIANKDDSFPPGFKPMEEASSAVQLHTLSIICTDRKCRNYEDVYSVLDRLPCDWLEIGPWKFLDMVEGYNG